MCKTDREENNGKTTRCNGFKHCISKRFRYVEGGPSADLTTEAYGSTLEEAFANTALAMFNAITLLSEVEKRDSCTVKVEGEDVEALLYNFLDELLYIHDINLVVFSDVNVLLDQENIHLTAECRGETFDLKRHNQGIAIKAVTFHQMNIEKRERGWIIRVVFDT